MSFLDKTNTEGTAAAPSRFNRHDIADAVRGDTRKPGMSSKAIRFQFNLADLMESLRPDSTFHDLLATIIVARGIGRADSLLDYINIWLAHHCRDLDEALQLVAQKAESERVIRAKDGASVQQ